MSGDWFGNPGPDAGWEQQRGAPRPSPQYQQPGYPSGTDDWNSPPFDYSTGGASYQNSVTPGRGDPYQGHGYPTAGGAQPPAAGYRDPYQGAAAAPGAARPQPAPRQPLPPHAQPQPPLYRGAPPPQRQPGPGAPVAPEYGSGGYPRPARPGDSGQYPAPGRPGDSGGYQRPGDSGQYARPGDSGQHGRPGRPGDSGQYPPRVPGAPGADPRYGAPGQRPVPRPGQPAAYGNDLTDSGVRNAAAAPWDQRGARGAQPPGAGRRAQPADWPADPRDSGVGRRPADLGVDPAATRRAPGARRADTGSTRRVDDRGSAHHPRDPRDRDDEGGIGGIGGLGGLAGDRDDDRDDDHAAFGLLRAADGDGEGGGRGRKAGKGGHKRSGFAVFVALVVVVAVLGGGGYLGYKYFKKQLAPPPDYTSLTGTSTIVQVTINAGDGATQIGAELLRADVVKSQQAFVDAAAAEPNSQDIQAGVYNLHTEMKASAAVQALLNPKNRNDNKSVLTVVSGQRAIEVFRQIANQTSFTVAQLEAAAKSGKVDLPAWANNNIEGFLGVGSYTLTVKGLTPTSLLKQMVDNALAMMQQDGITQANAVKEGFKSPYGLLILASLVRAEGRLPGDLPKIAEVAYNRMSASPPMPLQFDSATLYGLNRRSPQPTMKELNDKSNKYNLRVNYGLPPTPIGTVDDASLTAVVKPATGGYLYFCTINSQTGQTDFVDTSQELINLEQQYPACSGH